MTTSIWKHAFGAVALTTLVAGAANAAPATVSTNTNLRQGPGTQFGVIMTVASGSTVNVIRCGGEWCNVVIGGRPGYMIARNLGMGGPAPVTVVRAAPPPVVVVGPGPYPYGPYYGPGGYYGGPGYYYGPRRYWRRW